MITIQLAVPNKASAGTQPADIKLDFQLQDLNEGQDINAPENTKPFAS